MGTTPIQPPPVCYIPPAEKLASFGLVLLWEAPHARKYVLPNPLLEKPYWHGLALCIPAFAAEPDCVLLTLPTAQFSMSFRPASEAFFDELLRASRFLSLTPISPLKS